MTTSLPTLQPPDLHEVDRSGHLVLEARSVSKRFKGKPDTVALDDFSLRAYAGAVTGLVGPDGAGKTTLLRLAAGLLVPEDGTITALGLDCVKQTMELRNRIGYMPQQFGLYQDLTIGENLDLYADLQGVALDARPERFAQLLTMTGLEPFLERRAGKLSGGMKQKLGLACCLIKSPELLLLDEPTVGVDPVSRRELWEIVYQLVEEDGIGVLLATAYLDEADRCHHVVLMDHGKKHEEGSPTQFHKSVAGRVFLIEPAKNINPRQIQSTLALKGAALDVTIRSGKARCVLQGSSEAPLRQALPSEWIGSIVPAKPNFEDAFMAWSNRDRVDLSSTFNVADSDPETARGNNGDETAVSVKNMIKRFGDFVAVSDINFEVKRGEIFGLLGPNGAGKTTSFRMLCGLTSVSDGSVRVAGYDLRKAPSQARSRLGYMAQLFSLYRQLTVGQNLNFYGKAYGLGGKRLRQRIDWALDEFDLRNWKDRNAGDLPGGFRQRLSMATAMLHEPEILFLDEPTSGADPLARREFWLRINGFAQAGVTVIVTTHFMEEAEYCDRMLIMSRGAELAQGTPASIRKLARTEACPDPTIEDAFIFLADRESKKKGSSG
jgi:ABC-2 type transport system ATP-binding protein